MKRLFIIQILLLCSISIFAQNKVFSLNEDVSGDKMRKLEKEYKSGVGQDSIDAIFYKKEDVDIYLTKWSKFLGDMGKYLKENNFIINEKVFFRVFFAKDGSVEYLFYNIRNKESDLLSKEKSKIFEDLLNKYVESNKINISTKENFKQCGNGNFQLDSKK